MSQSSDQEADRIQDIDQLAERQNSLEAKVDQILDVISKFTGGKPAEHQAAQQQTESRLDRSSSVAEQVRAELAKAEQERASQQAAKDREESLAARLAKLEEKPPEPPQPRRQRVMWGAR